VVGLSRSNSLSTKASVEYGFSIDPTGEINVIESGVIKSFVGYLVEGDVFRIGRTGANIIYYWNNNQVYTTPSVATYVLMVDTYIGSGSLPIVSSSFQRVSQTYYAIANGNWNSANTWSLTDGGAPAPMYPSKGDIVNIKGFSVLVSSGIMSSNINVTVNNSNTCLKIDGAGSVLNVYGLVNLKGENNTEVSRGLIVQNDGKISINP